MMQLFINPVDTQFNRTGLPFDAGSDAESASFFPPFPRTLYGALRTQGIVSAGGSLKNDSGWEKEAYGTFNRKGNLSLRGPFLACKNNSYTQIFLPFPLDLVKIENRLCQLKPGAGLDASSGWDLDHSEIVPLLIPQDAERMPDANLLKDDYLVDYLTGKLDGEMPNECMTHDLFRSEERIGIGRNADTRTARDGHLYLANHFRLNDDCGLWAAIEGEHDRYPKQGVFQLGGEARAVSYQTLAEDKWWENSQEDITKMISKNGRFKAFFITPGLFMMGALPDLCIDEQNGIVEGGVKFILRGFCTGKSRQIGGWDIKKGRPKAMLKTVSPGSVYFFAAEPAVWSNLYPEQQEKIAQALYHRLNFQSWSKGETAQEGFGIPLLGGW